MHYDSFLSAQAQAILSKTITPHILATEHTKTIFHNLTTQIPSITSLTYRYKPTGIVYIALHASPPWLRIFLPSSTVIMTHDGHVIHENLYDNAYMEHVPTVHVTEKREYDDAFFADIKNFMHSLPAGFLLDYDVVWNNKMEIIIKPHAYPTMMVVTGHMTKFDVPLNALLNYFYQFIEDKKKLWKLDIRFKNYNILSRVIKGGV